MALKAVHVSDVPNLDHVTEHVTLSLHSTRFPKGMIIINHLVLMIVKKFTQINYYVVVNDFLLNAGVEMGRSGGFKMPKFVVIGHRGNGMNMLHSGDRRMKALKENSIISFNTAATFPVDFVEFDVQV